LSAPDSEIEDAPMKAESSSRISGFVYVICAFVGALIGLMVPTTKDLPVQHHGILAAMIAFELNYLNLLTTLGAIWLFYWLLKRRVRPREAMVMYGGLGFVCVRLIFASVNFFHK
jgi:uncharacterized BrkB/YihY/UPF0761 family membrane protein